MLKAIIYLACLYLALLCVGCGETSESLETARRTAELADPEPLQAGQTITVSPTTWYAAGRLHEAQGNIEQAMYKYGQAIHADADFMPAYNRLSIVYGKLDRYDLAEQVLKKALERRPDNTQLRNNLAYNYMHTGRYADAEAELRNVLTIDPRCRYARLNLGVVLARQRKFDRAMDMFAQAGPPYQANFNMGMVYQTLGEPDKADEYFRASLKLNPGFGPAKKALASVRRGRPSDFAMLRID